MYIMIINLENLLVFLLILHFQTSEQMLIFLVLVLELQEQPVQPVVYIPIHHNNQYKYLPPQQNIA